MSLLSYLLLAELQIETPTTAFLKAGTLGACIVVLAGVVVYLYRDHKEQLQRAEAVVSELNRQIGTIQQRHVEELAAVQAQRVADTQQVSEKLLRVNENTVAALTNATAAMEAQREADNELKLALKELSEEIRRVSIRR